MICMLGSSAVGPRPRRTRRRAVIDPKSLLHPPDQAASDTQQHMQEVSRSHHWNSTVRSFFHRRSTGRTKGNQVTGSPKLPSQEKHASHQGKSRGQLGEDSMAFMHPGLRVYGFLILNPKTLMLSEFGSRSLSGRGLGLMQWKKRPKLTCSTAFLRQRWTGWNGEQDPGATRLK
jgi:hypothetical protein